MQNRTISDLGERALIGRITARLPAPPAWVVVGPGDDAAVLVPPRGALDVVTTDAQVEGIHFDRRIMPPEAIGHRALAVNLSDLAAMGAVPRAALLSFVLPGTLDVAVVDGLLDGMLALAAAHRIAVVGGNIARSPGPIVIDVTAIGAVRRRQVLTRAGARPGDAVYVTGTIGDALVGLRALQEALDAVGTPSDGAWAAQIARYRTPEPRVRAGLLLGRNRAASACLDLSDGLADALRQVAAASQVGIAVDAAALPISADVRAWHERRGVDVAAAALAGGDDYELLFTARPRHAGRLRDVRRGIGTLPITRIGEVTRDPSLVVRTGTGTVPLPDGFEHFR